MEGLGALPILKVEEIKDEEDCDSARVGPVNDSEGGVVFSAFSSDCKGETDSTAQSATPFAVKNEDLLIIKVDECKEEEKCESPIQSASPVLIKNEVEETPLQTNVKTEDFCLDECADNPLKSEDVDPTKQEMTSLYADIKDVLLQEQDGESDMTPVLNSSEMNHPPPGLASKFQLKRLSVQLVNCRPKRGQEGTNGKSTEDGESPPELYLCRLRKLIVRLLDFCPKLGQEERINAKFKCKCGEDGKSAQYGELAHLTELMAFSYADITRNGWQGDGVSGFSESSSDSDSEDSTSLSESSFVVSNEGLMVSEVSTEKTSESLIHSASLITNEVEETPLESVVMNKKNDDEKTGKKGHLQSEVADLTEQTASSYADDTYNGWQGEGFSESSSDSDFDSDSDSDSEGSTTLTASSFGVSNEDLTVSSTFISEEFRTGAMSDSPSSSDSEDSTSLSESSCGISNEDLMVSEVSTEKIVESLIHSASLITSEVEETPLESVVMNKENDDENTEGHLLEESGDSPLQSAAQDPTQQTASSYAVQDPTQQTASSYADITAVGQQEQDGESDTAPVLSSSEMNVHEIEEALDCGPAGPFNNDWQGDVVYYAIISDGDVGEDSASLSASSFIVLNEDLMMVSEVGASTDSLIHSASLITNEVEETPLESVVMNKENDDENAEGHHLLEESGDSPLQSAVQEPTQQTTSSYAVQDPTQQTASSYSVQDPTQQTTSSYAVLDPTQQTTSSYAVLDPTQQLASLYAVQDPTQQTTSSYAVQDPTQQLASSYAVQDPTQQTTSSYAVQDPTQQLASSYAVQDPTQQTASSYADITAERQQEQDGESDMAPVLNSSEMNVDVGPGAVQDPTQQTASSYAVQDPTQQTASSYAVQDPTQQTASSYADITAERQQEQDGESDMAPVLNSSEMNHPPPDLASKFPLKRLSVQLV
ncbi:serine-aspartate repeat-containing protein F-like [Engraulis encrasicolus]|uniref:serine-aspartate repeat-containing protein F-like n=1 Tax=Engraulis encrasicolus TaxID=184585 RepID=UPI002FD0CD5B